MKTGHATFFLKKRFLISAVYSAALTSKWDLSFRHGRRLDMQPLFLGKRFLISAVYIADITISSFW
jgi:hypothetical protein